MDVKNLWSRAMKTNEPTVYIIYIHATPQKV